MRRPKTYKGIGGLALAIIIVALIIVLAFLILCWMTPTEGEYYSRTGTSHPKYDQIPTLEIPHDPFNSEIIKHEGYTLGYAEEHELPAWVAYELTREETIGGTERSDSFKADPAVSTGSATLNDYRKSGYDRGHMAPAADFKWSDEAMRETFYLSNMAPQTPSFNRGIWADLESAVRSMAFENGSVFVVTGPVLTDGPYETIGESEVTVPKNFYKVILDAREPEIKAIGFMLPNEGSDKALSSFATSVDSVELVTGIDFFPLLPDDAEESIEASYDVSLWPVRAFNASDAKKDTSYVIKESIVEIAAESFEDYFFLFKEHLFDLLGVKEGAKRLALI